MKWYAAYKDSGIEWIGEVPEHWSIDKIGAVYHVRNEKVSDQDFMPLSVTKNGIVPQLETAAKTDNGDNRKLVRKNDFVINSRSDRRGSCGISAYNGSCSLINTVLVPERDMSNGYYSHIFRSNHFSDEFYRWGSGIVDDLWSTKWADMKQIRIPSPSIEEQESISCFLDKKTSAIDELIADKSRMIELLREKRQAIISEAVTKGLDRTVPMKDSGIEWIGEVPEHWDIKKLRYIGKCQNGINKSGDEFGFGFPFVSYGDVYNNEILPFEVNGLINTSENEQKNYSVLENDVFFTRTSETIEEIGLSGICFKTIEKAAFAGFLIRFRPNGSYLKKEYSRFYFQCQLLRQYFVKEMCIVTRASLSQELLKNLLVVIPPINEQNDISLYLEKQTTNIDNLITDIESQIEKLKEYRQSLISAVVTGKVKVCEEVS